MTRSDLTFAVCGKNSIALAGARRLLRLMHERNIAGPLLAVGNRTDSGEDGWQPSFVKFARSHENIRLVALEDLYARPGLILFSLEFDRIIRVPKFKSPRLYNVHFSKLPAYKGMYTSVMPILRGETESGVTLHEIDPGIDTGQVLAQRTFPIGPDDTARDLYFNYLEAAEILFNQTVERVVDGDLEAHPQPARGSSYFSKGALNFGNLIVDFNKAAAEVHDQLRAYTFREYQLPEVFGHRISRSRITDARSTARPGQCRPGLPGQLVVSTVDYDVTLYCELIEGAPSGKIT